MVRQPEGIPKTLNQSSARRLLEEEGWVCQTGGRHVIKMTKPDCRPITLPAHRRRDYSPGLRMAILRQAGLLRTEIPSDVQADAPQPERER